jgi:hypothetical protein
MRNAPESSQMKDVDYRAALLPRLIRFRDAPRYLGYGS